MSNNAMRHARRAEAERVAHVVWLSGGKDSCALAFRLKQLNPDTPYIYPITPTGDELPEMFAHWRKISEMLGTPLTPIMHRRGLNGLISDQNALPNWRHRWCTRILKIEPAAAWLMELSKNYDRIVSHVGLRADEEERAGGDYAKVPGVEMKFDMREWGWGLAEVLNFLDEIGIVIPKRTDCARRFYQKLIEWYELWRDHTDIFVDAADQEVVIGHTFRSPGRDTQPTSLHDLGFKFMDGYVPKDTRDSINAMKCRVCRT